MNLENFGRLTTFALNKTGNLTTGHSAAAQDIGFEGPSEDEVLRIIRQDLIIARGIIGLRLIASGFE